MEDCIEEQRIRIRMNILKFGLVGTKGHFGPLDLE